MSSTNNLWAQVLTQPQSTGFWKGDRLLLRNKHTFSARDRSRSGWVSDFPLTHSHMLSAARDTGDLAPHLEELCKSGLQGKQPDCKLWQTTAQQEPLGLANQQVWPTGGTERGSDSCFLQQADHHRQGQAGSGGPVHTHLRNLGKQFFSISFWMQEKQTSKHTTLYL